jgi:hypothetical protein
MLVSIFVAALVARFVVVRTSDLLPDMDHLLDAFALLAVLSPTFIFFNLCPRRDAFRHRARQA